MGMHPENYEQDSDFLRVENIRDNLVLNPIVIQSLEFAFLS